MMHADCPFCRIGVVEDKSRLLYEDEQILAFKDINPQAPLHILIIPKRHIGTLLDLREGDIELAGRLLLVTNQMAKDMGIDRSGFRIVVNCNHHGGQTIDHLHLHLLGGRKMEWPPG
jgi:histidine triad (HIT) family protein